MRHSLHFNSPVCSCGMRSAVFSRSRGVFQIAQCVDAVREFYCLCTSSVVLKSLSRQFGEEKRGG